MTNLTNLLPEYSYADVLTTTNGGQGLDGVLRNLQDGLGNNSTLLIANNAVKFLYGGGNSLYLNDTALLSSGNNINLSTQNNPIFQGNGALTVPIGTTDQQPVPAVDGMIRYNSETASFEFRENGAWVGSAGVATITGTPNQIVVTGTTDVTLSLANNIDGILSLTTTNIAIDNLAVGAGSISTNSAIPLILKPNGNNSVQVGKNIDVGQPDVNNLEIRGGAQLKFFSGTGAAYSGWMASAGANVIYDLPTTQGSNGQFLKRTTTSGQIVTTTWDDFSADKIEVTVSQPGNPFLVGDIIRLDIGTNTYVKAVANSDLNSQVVGIVSVALDTFKYIVSGVASTGATPVVPGTLYYLDPDPLNAGRFTDVAPGPGKYSKPLFIAITTNTCVWLNQRGQQL